MCSWKPVSAAAGFAPAKYCLGCKGGAWLITYLLTYLYFCCCIVQILKIYFWLAFRFQTVWVLPAWRPGGRAGRHAAVRAAPVQSRPMARRPAAHQRLALPADCTRQRRRDVRKATTSSIRQRWRVHARRRETNSDRFSRSAAVWLLLENIFSTMLLG